MDVITDAYIDQSSTVKIRCGVPKVQGLIFIAEKYQRYLIKCIYLKF